MARPLRIQQAGLTYHVYARGIDRMPMFVDDDDRHCFRHLLTEVCDRFCIVCHAECQMTTHYHAVITTLEPNLSRAMQKLNGDYAIWFNRRHLRGGHFFERRFGAQIVQHGRYFLTACRYVVRNPVRAGMVATAEEWPWSSYRATVGLSPIPPYLMIQTLLGEFDSDLASAMPCFERFVMSDRRDALPRDPILGDRDFIARYAAAATAASREVPRRERHVEPLSNFFVGALTRRQRDAAIVRAYRAGFKLCEVARVLGVHYSTISKVLTRCQTLKNVAIQDLAPKLESGDQRPTAKR